MLINVEKQKGCSRKSEQIKSMILNKQNLTFFFIYTLPTCSETQHFSFYVFCTCQVFFSYMHYFKKNNGGL